MPDCRDQAAIGACLKVSWFRMEAGGGHSPESRLLGTRCFAADVAATRRVLDKADPCVLVGHSYGGVITPPKVSAVFFFAQRGSLGAVFYFRLLGFSRNTTFKFGLFLFPSAICR